MVDKIKCIHCRKVNYTAAPSFAEICSYCNQPLAKKLGRKKSGKSRGKQQSCKKR